MTKRMLLAGLLGGVGMFIWSSIAHMALPLGEAGIKEIPNEAPVLAAMQSSAGQAAGLYMFPGMGLPPNATSQQKTEAQNQYDQKLAANPSGILIYHPPGAQMMIGRRLTIEFLTELAASLLVVFLLGQTSLQSFGAKVGFVSAAGLMVAMLTNVQYWNWYSYPVTYTTASIFTQFAGFFVVGLIAAPMLKTPTAKAMAVAA
jgi:hypothetical protein